MWAIRRTSSISLRSTVVFRASYTEYALSSSSHVDKTQFLEPLSEARFLNRYYSYPHSRPALTHQFSSLAGTNNNSGEEEDDDLADGFSELEDSTTDEIQDKSVVEDDSDDDVGSECEVCEDKYQEKNVEEDDSDDVMVLEPEVSADEHNADTSVPEKTLKPKQGLSVLFKVIMDSHTAPVQKVLDNWLEKGGKVSRSDASAALFELKRRKMHYKALQLSEWLESRKQLEFTEKDYSIRVDLIAKTHGLNAAEIYIEKIPESYRTEMVYVTLLANCVQSVHITKAEQVLNKIKALKLPLTAYACNQLLLLYKRSNKQKIADVLLLMEKENVKPTAFTYEVLMDIKGQSNDINGMEQLLESMKSEGIDPDVKIQAVLARHYINGGLKEKAKAILQEIEGNDLKENRGACSVLLLLYALLDSVADVSRVWDVCKSNPRLDEYMKAIEAYGKLKKVEEAEAVFDQMSKKVKTISASHYATMLKVYAGNKMLSKGKDLVKQMAESGCEIGPWTWDSLVRLYIEAGEIEKADSILHKLSEQNRLKPFFDSYLLILDQYAKRGDIYNAEKMFHRMRQDGYVSRLKQYHSLLRAYIIAKTPAYGFKERMKADKVFPNKAMAEQLAQVDAFKKTAVSDLLD